jgi:hypothetical protein
MRATDGGLKPKTQCSAAKNLDEHLGEMENDNSVH